MPCMNTVMIWQTRSTGSGDTERLGEALGKLLRRFSRSPVPQASGLKPPAVLELCSDLGGGKTTFARGLVRGLGSSDKVSSPTFTLNRIYKANHLEIHHFDFYRLKEPGVVSDQLEESLQNSRVITIVEWSDIVRGALPEDRLTIEFKPVKDNPDERQIEITYPESKLAIIEHLEIQTEELKP